jgi:hypothetical protein
MLSGSSEMFFWRSSIVFLVVEISLGLYLASTFGERGAAILFPSALVHFLDEFLFGDSTLAFLSI